MNMIKRKIMVVFIFLCLVSQTFTFDMVSCKQWEDVIYGPEFFIDWELKGEDWGKQFCNIWGSNDTSHNHRHFLESPRPLSGAAPAFVDYAEGETYFIIKCVKDRKNTYIHVALDSWNKVLAVWRQAELAY